MLFLIIVIVFRLLYQSEATSFWYFKSQDNIRVTPLTHPLDLLKPPFNVNLTTVVYTFGYNGTTNDTATLAIINAYLQYKQRSDINVVLLDWEREANISIHLRIFGTAAQYSVTAVPNTKKIGDELGTAFIRLSHHGLNLNKVHLIGHSLGAHLMGYTGKFTKSFGKIISRITGLDPAGPAFEGHPSLEGLKSGDAGFVDVIHTNPKLFGTLEQIGDVDIWFNCGLPHQPGCEQYNLEACSHYRACLYFAESINSVRGFVAMKGQSCSGWRSGRNNSDKRIIFVGDTIDTQVRGKYFLSTNPSPPFARGSNGVKP